MFKVKSFPHFNRLLNRGYHNYFINLKGKLRSSKFINWSDIPGKDYFVLNLSDESEQYLTEAELFDKKLTNIGYALYRDALYCYDEKDDE